MSSPKIEIYDSMMKKQKETIIMICLLNIFQQLIQRGNNIKTYIQIGANIGTDEFYDLCNNENDRCNIHLIEANSNLIPTLKNNYENLIGKHNIYFHEYGIVPTKIKNYNKLYLYDNNMDLSSVVNRQSFQHISEVINFIPITFDEFCFTNNINEIDYLSIDTEGLDYEILLSIDIDKNNIKHIVFEKWHYTNDDLDQKVQTGNDIFYLIEQKFKNYSLREISIDRQPSYGLRINKLK